MKDERVVAVMRRAQSGGFMILFLGLMFIIFYRDFILGQSFGEFGDIVIVWLAGGVYVAVAGAWGGVEMSGDRGPRKWRQPVAVGLGVAGVQLFHNLFHHDVSLASPAVWLALPFSFLSGFAVTALAQAALGRLYRRWERKHLEE